METMTERQSKILHILASERKIEVGKLAELVEVSQVTIRKDLDVLVEKGLIKRQHGFAQLIAENDISNRLVVHYERKLDIARRAVELIEDGDTIMLESGSCCALLAEQIAKNRRNVTIITYSVFIANHIRPAESNQVVLLGGSILMEPMVTVGPLAVEAVSRYYVDKFFTGTDGITPNGEFTAQNLEMAEVIRAMSKRARHTIVMTDSSKFMRQGTVVAFPVKDVYAVFTDTQCPRETQEIFKKNNVIVNMGKKNSLDFDREDGGKIICLD